jgi:hypothetical protein
MKMPWEDKTGLGKAAAFFATLLLVSIGLCGANFVGVLVLSSTTSGLGPGRSWWRIPMTGLTFAAYIELLGIFVGAVGMVIVAIAFAIRAIMRAGKDS